MDDESEATMLSSSSSRRKRNAKGGICNDERNANRLNKGTRKRGERGGDEETRERESI